MNKTIFADIIVEWYQANQRSLPWRETDDPYKIWLSEIILQQTRVAQGLPYYLEFVERFPDVFALANAREQVVLRLWQGLGYYTRARNLHRCARIVVKDYQGQFPQNYEDLKKLPGIGNYTAAAIASIAFGEPVAALDGNAYRVFSRVFGIEEDIHSGKGKDFFEKFANAVVSKKDPAAFNQALMDFGATRCLPQNPFCEECIFRKGCIAFAQRSQQRLPVKIKKSKIRIRYFYYFVIEQNKRRLMVRRGPKDIWQGLYDFYLVETRKPENPQKIFSNDPLLKQFGGVVMEDRISNLYKHVLTHQKLRARFVPVRISSSVSIMELIKSKKMKLYSSKEIDRLPKPALVSRYLLESPFL